MDPAGTAMGVASGAKDWERERENRGGEGRVSVSRRDGQLWGSKEGMEGREGRTGVKMEVLRTLSPAASVVCGEEGEEKISSRFDAGRGVRRD